MTDSATQDTTDRSTEHATFAIERAYDADARARLRGLGRPRREGALVRARRGRG